MFDGPGPGRPKGSPNKTTIAVKEALEAAFDGIGGVPALIEWAQTDAGRAEFYRIWAKMLPKNIKVEIANNFASLVAEARARVMQGLNNGNGHSS